MTYPLWKNMLLSVEFQQRIHIFFQESYFQNSLRFFSDTLCQLVYTIPVYNWSHMSFIKTQSNVWAVTIQDEIHKHKLPLVSSLDTSFVFITIF